MAIQSVAVVLALIAFATKNIDLFYIAGVIALLLDLLGFLSGKLNPLFPIIIYGISILVVEMVWEGILFGALVSNALELLILLAGTGITFALKEDPKKEELD